MTGEPDDALLARYLVGTCSEAEKARVEEAFFAQDAVFERMQQIEEDLIERRLRGDLTATERDSFDVAYASPARRERLLFTRALQRVLRTSERGASPALGRWTWPRRSSGVGLALAAAAVVVAMVGAGVIAWQANGLRSSLRSTQADNDALRRERDAARQRLGELEGRASTLADELNRERATRPAGGAAPPVRSLVATFVLSPGLLRGTRAPARLLVPPTIDEARLQLDLEADIDARRFRAELRGNDSRLVRTQDGMTVTPTGAGGAVVLTLPAAILQTGEYEVVLLGASGPGGFEEIARYYFAAVRD